MIIQSWEQWGNAFSLCVHFVSCTFYFRYTSGHCLIDIVSPLWGCLSRRQLFSYGNSEVMHSACVHFVNCAFYFRYTSGHCLINIVSLLWGCLSCRQLFSHGNSEVMHSACVCILSIVLSSWDTLLVIVSSTLFSIVGMFVSSTIIQPWEQWGNAFSLCVHFVSCTFYFRYTSGHCLIDIVSPLWGCLSRRQLFSYGNSEVMHSACVCILSIVLFISDTLLVIVSLTLFLCCGGVCLVDNYSAMETVR